MLVASNGGGGKGEWSLEQLPNASSSTVELLTETQRYALLGDDGSAGAGAGQCHLQEQTCYPGNDAAQLVLGTVDECCTACAGNASCAGFTFRQNPPGQPTCFLKTVLRGASRSGCTSGFKSGSHPLPPLPPAPNPAPPVPSGHLLYSTHQPPPVQPHLACTRPGTRRTGSDIATLCCPQTSSTTLASTRRSPSRSTPPPSPSSQPSPPSTPRRRCRRRWAIRLARPSAASTRLTTVRRSSTSGRGATERCGMGW